ncbi:MAG: SsrA-binding protein SmpB [Flavobacteriaceae bacterium]
MQKKINIQNKRARFEYELIEQYTAGLVLTGTEIKSIRLGKATITDSFCEFNERGELFVINMNIQEYAWGTRYNHRPKAERKLLMNKRELRKLEKEVKNVGLTIVPLRVFITDKGYAKLVIALAKGKKLYDKRETIKDRENKRNLDRVKKAFRK